MGSSGTAVLVLTTVDFLTCLTCVLPFCLRRPNRQYLMQECLAVRGRAMAGRAANGAGAHWSDYTGKQKLSEVIGRAAGGSAALGEALMADL